MSPTAFRKLLAAWEMRQIDVAALLGVNARTVKGWAALDGPGVTSEPAARFLAYLKATGVNPATVAKILKHGR